MEHFSELLECEGRKIGTVYDDRGNSEELD